LPEQQPIKNPGGMPSHGRLPSLILEFLFRVLRKNSNMNDGRRPTCSSVVELPCGNDSTFHVDLLLNFISVILLTWGHIHATAIVHRWPLLLLLPLPINAHSPECPSAPLPSLLLHVLACDVGPAVH
jgi:hypothetical protein